MKDQIRKNMVQKRKQLTRAEQDAASQELTKKIIQHPFFVFAKTIAAYVAVNGEINPEPILHMAKSLGKRCVLPAITDYDNKAMQFFDYLDPMYPNRYGILEPSQHQSPVAYDDIDVILVPLVAYDLQGTRLGMGAGFYDRYLPKLNNAMIVGLAYEWQAQDALLKDEWDVPMHFVLSI